MCCPNRCYEARCGWMWLGDGGRWLPVRLPFGLPVPHDRSHAYFRCRLLRMPVCRRLAIRAHVRCLSGWRGEQWAEPAAAARRTTGTAAGGGRMSCAHPDAVPRRSGSRSPCWSGMASGSPPWTASFPVAGGQELSYPVLLDRSGGPGQDVAHEPAGGLRAKRSQPGHGPVFVVLGGPDWARSVAVRLTGVQPGLELFGGRVAAWRRLRPVPLPDHLPGPLVLPGLRTRPSREVTGQRPPACSVAGCLLLTWRSGPRPLLLGTARSGGRSSTRLPRR